MITTQEEVGLVEATHEYFEIKTRAPLVGVTEVLTEFGFIEPEWYTEWARVKGSATHLALHLLKENRLDWDTVDKQIKGYIAAHELFVKETGYQSLYSEYRAWNPIRRYAGTIDDLGILYDKPALIDFKTGKVMPWTAMQTGGYEGCKLPKEFTGVPIKRYGLELRADGSYFLTPFANPHDKDLFAALVSTLYWKRNNGYKKKPKKEDRP